METEVRRLHRWSWPFIAAGTVRAMLIPIAGAVFASGGVLLSRLELLTLLFLVPAFAFAFVRQQLYSYWFTDSELIVRDGLLTRNVRHISYERIHNVALARNPIHRMLGVTTARIETAAGGKPEAMLRVLSLEAAEELRLRTLGADRTRSPSDSETSPADGPLLRVPDRELVRLALISNRGFLVAAAAAGVASQVQWWESDWFERQNWSGIYEWLRDSAPGWTAWLFESGAILGGLVLLLVLFLMLFATIRVFSVVWYLVRYRGFTLHRDDDELRAEYGLWPEVSSLIPLHRIQLLTVSESLLHRWARRVSIDLETAGATDTDSGLSGASGTVNTRQWLAPILATQRAAPLVREVLPEIDLDGVQWQSIEPRAARRLVFRVVLAVLPITLGVAALLALTPIPLSAWHALWLPLIVIGVARPVARQWVRHTGYALTDHAILFRSGWISRQVSAVRFVNAQTVAMRQSPFDRRRRMASVAVDTAGAGGLGHRIDIPFLDIEVAETILRRLYDETRITEFRW